MSKFIFGFTITRTICCIFARTKNSQFRSHSTRSARRLHRILRIEKHPIFIFLKLKHELSHYIEVIFVQCFFTIQILSIEVKFILERIICLAALSKRIEKYIFLKIFFQDPSLHASVVYARISPVRIIRKGTVFTLKVFFNIRIEIFNKLLDSRIGRILKMHFQELFSTISFNILAVRIEKQDGMKLNYCQFTLRGYNYTFFPYFVLTTRLGTLITLYYSHSWKQKNISLPINS
jgi:hypothetical protein